MAQFHMNQSLWILGLLSILIGCQSKVSPSKAAASASAKPATVPSVQAMVLPDNSNVPKSYPSDIKLTEVKQQLDCAKGTLKNACAVVKEFESAPRFKADTPSGESRWFGKAYIVEKGTERMEYLMLVSRTVPTATVGASSLPLGISMGGFPIEVQVEAATMWRKLSSGRHRTNRRNLAFKHLEAFEPKNEQGAINTTGTSVQLIPKLGEDIGYLRQPELKRLLMVRPSLARDSSPGDGTYVEFWQATW
jgi:hypothetical protein